MLRDRQIPVFNQREAQNTREQIEEPVAPGEADQELEPDEPDERDEAKAARREYEDGQAEFDQQCPDNAALQHEVGHPICPPSWNRG